MTEEAARTAMPILVLGMHRGGTSALAGALRGLGVDLGPSLMQPAEGVNDKGFFEHLEAFRIHERLLAALGRSRFDPREMPVGWREHPAFRVAVDEVRALIERDFSSAPCWAVKDPRMCRVAPVWLTALAQIGLVPRVIVIARHPAEVARSLQAQRWIASPARSHLCWLQHMLEAEEATRGVPRALITYDALLVDWRDELARAARELVIEWPRPIVDRERDIDAFLDHNERHFDEGAEHHGQDVPGLAAELFAACRARGADPWPRIAALGEIFRRGAAAFGPCLDEAIVEASLVRLELGQGRVDPVAAADPASAPSQAGAFDARLTQLYEIAALTSTRLDAVDALLRDLAVRLADREQHAADPPSVALSALPELGDELTIRSM